MAHDPKQSNADKKTPPKATAKVAPPIQQGPEPLAPLQDTLAAHPALASQAATIQRLPKAQQQAMIQRLSQQHGNQHVQRLVAQMRSATPTPTPTPRTPPLIQAKLTVNDPGDAFEQEADTVADQVMRMPAPATPPPDEGQQPTLSQEPQLGSSADSASNEINSLKPQDAPADPAAISNPPGKIDDATGSGNTPPAANELATAETDDGTTESVLSAAPDEPVKADEAVTPEDEGEALPPEAQAADETESQPLPETEASGEEAAEVPAEAITTEDGAEESIEEEEVPVAEEAEVDTNFEDASDIDPQTVMAINAELNEEEGEPAAEEEIVEEGSTEGTSVNEEAPAEENASEEAPSEEAPEVAGTVSEEGSAEDGAEESDAAAESDAATDAEAASSEVPAVEEASVEEAAPAPAEESESSAVPSEDEVATPQPDIALSSGETVQTKLVVNTPGDAYEAEADRVAQQVLQMPSARSTGSPVVTRKIQRAAKDGAEVPANTEAKIQGLQSGGRALSSEERAFYEPRFGQDFSHVRIHTNKQAVQLSQDLKARAFTVGSTIAFGDGEYRPGSDEGKKLMAHELTHVVQQTGPRQIAAKHQQHPNIQRTSKPQVQRFETPEWVDKGLDGAGELLEGAWYGDYVEDPSVLNIIGQVAIGFVPYAGQLADIRDFKATWEKMQRGEAGWVDVTLAGVAFIPGIGDLAKGLSKSKHLTKLTRLVEPISKFGKKYLGKGKKFMGDVAQGGRKLLGGIRKKGSSWLKTGKTKLGNLFNKGKKGLSDGFNWGKSKIKSITGAGRKTIGKLANKGRSLLSSGKKLGQKAISKSKGLLSKTKRKMKGALQKGRNVLNKTKQKLGKALKNGKKALNIGKQKFQGLMAKGRTKYQQAKRKVSQKLNSAKNKLASAKNKLFGLMRRKGGLLGKIADGLDGLIGGAKSAVSKLTNKFNTLKSKGKNALKIASDSLGKLKNKGKSVIKATQKSLQQLRQVGANKVKQTKQFFGKMKRKASSYLSKGRQWAGKVRQKVVDFANKGKAALPRLWKRGREMVSDVRQGVTNKLKQVKEAVTSKLKKTRDGLQERVNKIKQRVKESKLGRAGDKILKSEQFKKAMFTAKVQAVIETYNLFKDKEGDGITKQDVINSLKKVTLSTAFTYASEHISDKLPGMRQRMALGEMSSLLKDTLEGWWTGEPKTMEQKQINMEAGKVLDVLGNSKDPLLNKVTDYLGEVPADEVIPALTKKLSDESLPKETNQSEAETPTNDTSTDQPEATETTPDHEPTEGNVAPGAGESSSEETPEEEMTPM